MASDAPCRYLLATTVLCPVVRSEIQFEDGSVLLAAKIKQFKAYRRMLARSLPICNAQEVCFRGGPGLMGYTILARDTLRPRVRPRHLGTLPRHKLSRSVTWSKSPLCISFGYHSILFWITPFQLAGSHSLHTEVLESLKVYKSTLQAVESYTEGFDKNSFCKDCQLEHDCRLSLKILDLSGALSFSILNTAPIRFSLFLHPKSNLLSSQSHDTSPGEPEKHSMRAWGQ